MTVRVRLRPAADEAAVRPVWQELERRVGNGRLTTSWMWTSLWLRHYGDAVQARFAVVERAGEPIAAVLLVVSRRGPRLLPVRTLHVGTAGEPEGHTVFVEYNDLLCAPEDRTDVVRAVGRAILELPGWDELDLPGFRAETADAIGSVIPLEQRVEPSWTMRLHPDRPIPQALPGSTRRLVRQAVESLEPGEPELITDVVGAAQVLAELAALHQARWTGAGQPGAFASPRFSGFLTDIVRAWSAEGRARLYRLAGPSGTLGCVLGFVEHDRFLYYQAGVRQFRDNRKRAGLLCHALFAEDCRRRGLREYEFLAGDARFKRQLSCGESNSLVWGRYAGQSPRARAVNSARQLRRSLAERTREHGRSPSSAATAG